VGKEEAPFRVMGVRVRLGKLVMDAMVSAPFVNGVLTRRRLHEGEEDPQREGGFVGPMRPETVCPTCDPEGGDVAVNES